MNKIKELSAEEQCKAARATEAVAKLELELSRMTREAARERGLMQQYEHLLDRRGAA